MLGRSGEDPGGSAAVSRAGGGRVVLDQELACGPGAPGGWDGPAVLAGHRALGQLVVVRPEFSGHAGRGSDCWGRAPRSFPLAGPAALVTAVAPDALRLRRVLDEALGDPGTGPRRLIDRVARRSAGKSPHRTQCPLSETLVHRLSDW